MWQAARFVVGVCPPDTAKADVYELGYPEHWLISRLQRTEATIAAHIANYRF